LAWLFGHINGARTRWLGGAGRQKGPTTAILKRLNGSRIQIFGVAPLDYPYFDITALFR
jgi:hypothetical protein